MVLTTLYLRSHIATRFRITFGVAGYSVVTPKKYQAKVKESIVCLV